MKTVPDSFQVMGAPEAGPQRSFLTGLIRMLGHQFGLYGFRLNRVLPKDGTEVMQGPLRLKPYTVATLPTASDHPGGVIYVSDGAAGTKFRGSDGSSWVNLG